ncbi:MAG TPA: MBL fold metallo-hydrolase [Phycisphaerales bacterium]|nr:MBL fold metallo-hydrolase [Phycisphaerales bacterium]
MFEQLAARMDGSSPTLSRRAAIGAFSAAGLTAAALGRIGQPPVPPQPTAPPVGSPPAPAKPQPATPTGISLPAGTDLNGAGFYRFKVGGVGGFTLTLLTDGSMPMSLGMFGGGPSREDVEAAAAEAMIPPARMMGHVHGLLIDAGAGDGGRVLVDTGCGSGMGSGTGRLLRSLALAGVTPAQIGAVVITHAHPDHVGGLMEGAGPNVFPSAHFFVAKAEVDFWMSNPDLGRSHLDVKMKDAVKMTAKTLFTQLSDAAFKDRLHLVGDGDRVIEGVSLTAAPGHTPGHSAVTVASAAERFVYLTDLAHHAPIQFPHPEWHVAYDTDPVQAAKTRRSMLTKVAAEKTLVSGAHLPFPAVGYVKKDGSGFTWVPRVWEW